MDEALFHALLQKGAQHNATDILFKVGQPPAFRVSRQLHYLQGDKLTPEQTQELARIVMRHTRYKGSLEDLLQFDTAYAVPGSGRYRVNVYRQRGSFAMALRTVPLSVPSFEQIGAPSVLRTFAELERGLVLVVGAAGNGKSTTLAATIGHINRTRRVHIVTIEDPIEYLHADQLGTVSQREVGIDTESFYTGLRAALRQNPDVILVGEIRDPETMDIALQAAETGHLVLSTLHTPDVARTVGRVLALSGDLDPQETRERFADSLRGIVAQRLLSRADGQGLALACEVLVVTGTARDSLKRPEGNLPLKEVMERGTHPYGMHTFEMHVAELARNGTISVDVARQSLA